MSLRARSNRRIFVFLLSSLAAIAAVQGSWAYTAGQGGTRAVTAEVVAQSVAYSAITATGCTVNPITGGGCNIVTLANKGTAVTSYWLNETSDPQNIATPASSSIGAVAVGATRNVGITIAVKPALAPCVNDLEYTLEGGNSGTLHARATGIVATVTYSPC